MFKMTQRRNYFIQSLTINKAQTWMKNSVSERKKLFLWIVWDVVKLDTRSKEISDNKDLKEKFSKSLYPKNIISIKIKMKMINPSLKQIISPLIHHKLLNNLNLKEIKIKC